MIFITATAGLAPGRRFFFVAGRSEACGLAQLPDEVKLVACSENIAPTLVAGERE